MNNSKNTNSSERVMLSIPVVYQKTGIQKPILRKLCAEKKIACLKIGNKYLVNYPELLNKLASNELKVEE